MRCPYCQSVNPPTAKFCLECGRQLLVCPNCGSANPPNAKFCIECGTALRGERDQPSGSSQQTQPLPDGILANPEERRLVTIMFADITGSTPLADHLDPEDMRAILTGYFNLMTAQIRKHDGTVEKYIGDAVMAVFGAPIAHEDDPDRALRAALDMQAALARFNSQRQALDPEATRLQMRIGINTGEVAAPGNSQYSRRDFLITGDAVNVASRLQAAATPDTILVGERTYLTTREVFNFQTLAPLQLKGKAEPIPAWIVLGLHNSTSAITQHPRGIEGLDARFIGRELELQLMHATYDRVQKEQRPHLITLLGTPGIGKSRLVREFIEQEQTKAKSASSTDNLLFARVLQGRCPPYGDGVTYRPLAEILNSLLHIQDDESYETLEARFIGFVRETLTRDKSSADPAQVADAIIRSVGRRSSDLAGIQNYTEGPEHRSASVLEKNTEQPGPQMALMRAWRAFLESLAAQQPLIIVIDDLQWADEALLDLLEYLTDRVANVPILFICPARPELFERRRDWGGGRRNFTALALESLSAAESNELVDALLKTGEIPGVLRYTIVSRAEGNPFFVEEIVRMLIDQQVLIDDDGCWRPGSSNEEVLGELASPAAPPEDSLIDLHYVFPLPRVPDTIQGVLAARVDLLNHREKLILQHASIIGRTFWLAALLELAADLAEQTIVETLNSLMQHDFISESEKNTPSPLEHDRVFVFKHVLIRDVVYNNLPRMRRAQEHARLALWLEEKTAGQHETFAELLAYHYQQALLTWSAGISLAAPVAMNGASTGPESETAPVRLTRPELRRRAIIYVSLAGDQALHSYFTIRAIQAYSEALELLSDSNADALTLSSMHAKLGHAYTQRGNADEAWQEYRRALQLLAAEPQMESERLLALYNHLAELGARWIDLFTTNPALQDIRTYIDAGLRLLEGRPLGRQHAEFLTYQAFWYVMKQARAIDTQERAEFARLALLSANEAWRIAEELDDTSARWITLDALAYVYRRQHKYQDSHRTQHQRLQLAEQIHSREELYDLYYSLGWVHEAVSDYATAARWFGEAWRVAQTMESPTLLLNSMNGRMHVWQGWCRWPDAREAALSILRIIEQFQLSEQWQLDALEVLAIIAYRTGQQEEGERYTRQFRRIFDQYCTQPGASPAMPSIYLAREDWTRALAEYRQKLQQSEPLPAPKVLASMAELIVIMGADVDAQRACCERAVLVTDQSGGRQSAAAALRARGRMYLEQQDWAHAEEDLQRSLHRCRELGLPWEQGKTLYCLGLLYRRRADVLHSAEAGARKADLGRAQFHFEQALGFFESLRAVHDAERARLAMTQNSRVPV